MNQFVFLINPRSGVSGKLHLPELIERFGKKYQKEFQIIFTNSEQDALEKTKQAVSDKAFAVVAAGGDGTANVTARNLLHSETALGIIPVGSGNGLARHLGISLKAVESVENIFSGKIISIDTGKLNDQLFLSNCGVGFLADVIHSFHGSKMRGYTAYAMHTFKKYFDSENVRLKISIDNHKLEEEFFFVSVCNANQFGYEIKMAPDASLTDGVLEFYLVNKINAMQKIGLMIKVMRGKSYSFSKAKLFKAENAELIFDGELKAQIDGDPILIQSPSKIQILKSSLKVIVPN